MKTRAKRFLTLAVAVIMIVCSVGCGADVDINVNVSSAQTDSSDDTTTSIDTSSGAATSESAVSSTQSKPVSSNSSSDAVVDTTVYEKPNSGNDTVMFNKQTSKYDSQANTLRQSIINAKDSGLKGDTTYYISYRGSDSNSGTSPETPWKTISKLNKMQSKIPNDSVILFERGGVYRGTIVLKSNVSYGAYGTGSKPCIYGSPQNYADESLWKESTKYDGAWEVKISSKPSGVGHVVFDHGAKVATPMPAGSSQAEDYTFVYNASKGILYLFTSDNPAKLHKDIEIAVAVHVIQGAYIKNVTIENLCVKYAGLHGMSLAETENVTVRNCEVGYIGGTGSNPPIGNGIEFWANTKNAKIENCWVYQCYDAGITHQGNDCVQEKITFQNNLIEYCIYGIEYFVENNKGTIKDTVYKDNIIRFSGFGWDAPDKRKNETLEKPSCAAICGWSQHGWKYNGSNFVIENNIIDTSYSFLMNISNAVTGGHPIIKDNTYYQKKGVRAAVCVGEKGGTRIPAESDSQLKSAIAEFLDSSAKLAELVD